MVRRDMGVTVTRESRVTSANKGVTFDVTQRVSHATTTTPHPTSLVVTALCGSWVTPKSNLAVCMGDWNWR